MEELFTDPTKMSFTFGVQASQCVGRVIRSKADYGLMVFADEVLHRATPFK